MSNLPPIPDNSGGWRVTRRGMGKAGAAALAAQAVGVQAQPTMPQPQPASAASAAATPTLIDVRLTVNGREQAITVDTRTTLLDALREHLHLTGTKKGCDHGQCGACTVIVDGRRINSCLTLAVMHEGDSITTIEGLGTPDKLHPMQAAFVKHDGYPVRLLHARPDLLGGRGAGRDQGRHPEPCHRRPEGGADSSTDAELRERMSGNICRCGAYSNIVDAITEVAGRPA